MSDIDDGAPEGDAAASRIVMDRLRNDIIMGVFRPGQRLRLIELKARYDVGSSPLREALSRLAAQQLVLQETNRGFSVPTVSVDELEDIIRLRRELECAALADSVAHGGDGWEDQLVVAHRRLKRLTSAGDISDRAAAADVVLQWEQQHRQFHLALIAACRSQWTLRFCATLNDQFDRYRRFARPPAPVQARLAGQHDALTAAALERDAAACVKLMDEHVTITGEAVRAMLLTRLDA